MAKKLTTGTGRAARRGFTLIEVLVTLAILAILVAVLFPIVLDQLDDADPTRTASDLASIRSGIELFQLNVRPSIPGDLEDLAFQITTADQNIEGIAFTEGETQRWRGPYLDLATTEGAAVTGNATSTGFGGNIQLELELFDSSANATTTTVGDADWVAVTILDVSETQFEEINALIDGEDEVTDATEGRLRFTADHSGDGATTDDPAVWYLAVPYRN